MVWYRTDKDSGEEKRVSEQRVRNNIPGVFFMDEVDRIITYAKRSATPIENSWAIYTWYEDDNERV